MQNKIDNSVDDLYKHEINSIPVKTGDLICTADGDPSYRVGQFWWIIGQFIPGDVDHIAIYVGPEGRCVEAGAKGKVITFNIQDGKWDAQLMYGRRAIIDDLYGVADPTTGRNFTADQEIQIRIAAARYCFRQAKEEKPYNLNFLESETDEAFYCSQLAYKAYKTNNINLNTNKSIPSIPFTNGIVFPQEVWAECKGKKLFVE